jgi:hypothetical protein
MVKLYSAKENETKMRMVKNFTKWVERKYKITYSHMALRHSFLLLGGRYFTRISIRMIILRIVIRG